MRVVLAGASGLIGTTLLEGLRADGHDVKILVRRDPAGPDEDTWDPARGLLDPDLLAGADAVVCLSGAGVGDHRWTTSYKKTIVSSRINSVGTVARAMASADGPRVLLTASGVGYYGDTQDQIVTEKTPPGDSFLSDVCVRWEQAADPAREAGVRVVHLRTGLVLSATGGLLGQLKPFVQLGVAGKLGNGRQYMPWISLADEIAAILFLLDHEVSGAVNLTAPAPVRNAEFMASLGRVLHRPTILPTPGFALRVVLGEFAAEVLAGQQAVPRRLAEAGFRHEHTELESALRWALGR